MFGHFQNGNSPLSSTTVNSSLNVSPPSVEVLHLISNTSEKVVISELYQHTSVESLGPPAIIGPSRRGTQSSDSAKIIGESELGNISPPSTDLEKATWQSPSGFSSGLSGSSPENIILTTY